MSSGDNILVEITPQVLLKAYACGIFPMAESAEDPSLYWIEPHLRGVLPLDAFHVPRSLRKSIRSEQFDVRIDSDFEAVIDGCATPAPDRRKTWINAPIRRLYGELFDMGFCHTIEVWREGDIIGGLYGIRIGGAFFGESMFHRVRDASKVALVYLVARLIEGGFSLLDTQFTTDHLRRFGATQISRRRYHRLLENALAIDADFHRLPTSTSSDVILQLVSQTS